MGLNLKDAEVIGFYSLPPLSLAEANPSAYNNALTDAPSGAGTCQHCGTPIIHHVLIRTDGHLYVIGCVCAGKVGCEHVARCAREGKTSDQIKQDDAKREAEVEAYRQHEEQRKVEEEARMTANRERFADILTALKSTGSDFHASLATQLVDRGCLSERQADYAVKALFPTGRRNKKNADAWDEAWDRITEMKRKPEDIY